MQKFPEEKILQGVDRDGGVVDLEVRPDGGLKGGEGDTVEVLERLYRLGCHLSAQLAESGMGSPFEEA